MTCLHRASAFVLALCAASLAANGAAAQSPQQASSDCFWQLAHGRGAEIACAYPAWLTEEERNDLQRLTRGVLQDLRCSVSIRIRRALVDDALELTDHVFESPPQPVACQIATKDNDIPITATFAPRVVIKDGRAIEATPRLADVKGVNSYLAWPVVQYVNSAPGIRKEMLRMINAYLARVGTRALARQ